MARFLSYQGLSAEISHMAPSALTAGRSRAILSPFAERVVSRDYESYIRTDHSDYLACFANDDLTPPPHSLAQALGFGGVDDVVGDGDE